MLLRDNMGFVLLQLMYHLKLMVDFEVVIQHLGIAFMLTTKSLQVILKWHVI